MCLINAERIYPEKDIVVYKFIIREPDLMEKWRYRSPFYEQYWQPEERMDSRGPVEKDLMYEVKKDSRPNFIISGNAFHAFAHISDARRYAKEWAWYSGVETAVGEFVIPKDSAEVYVGGNSPRNTIESYASTSMIFKRPVMNWEEIQIY